MPYQLRITIDHDPDTFKPLPQASRSFSAVEKLLTYFIRGAYNKNKPSVYTYGRETLDKSGDLCKPHIHFHFDIDPVSFRSLREWFQSFALKEFDITLKFNSVWCFQEKEPDTLKDAFSIYGYPLKTQSADELTNLTLNNINNIIDPSATNPLTLKLLRRDAHTVFLRTSQKNKLYKSQSADKKSLYQKLEKYVLENQPPIICHKSIWITILNYYQSQNKAICPKTLNGYTLLYLLNQKYLTPEIFYALNSPDNNLILTHNAPILQKTSTETSIQKESI